MRFNNIFFLKSTIILACLSILQPASFGQIYPSYSGVYPHLAFYNDQGECGTGAVVFWAGRLWAITYSPHMPHGSTDKLYEIDPELNLTVRVESIGGTPANRMVHRESSQLFIGPYAINGEGVVRSISYEKMPGRHTGNARHLYDPSGKIYYATMEEGFYEVDVKTLQVNTLYKDGHEYGVEGDNSFSGPLLPGAHGKGLYSGQRVLVYTNNGEQGQAALTNFDIESGALAEWDGKDWTVIRRNQFVEVTGPGSIYGNDDPENDPIWATGWDHKSLLVGVRDRDEGWSFYRLPKASHSYDGAHGWNTEWPRIRNVGTARKPNYLMTMHGMFWKFPGNFSTSNSAGILPKSAYLKVIGDFTRWNNRLIFGCDDSAQREFLNKRSAKGGIEGPGQSNSNLWFTSLDQPDKLGPNTAVGAAWLEEMVGANKPSEPFLLNGWDHRSAWIKNHDQKQVMCSFEIDVSGDGTWKRYKNVIVDGGRSERIVIHNEVQGVWIRAKLDKSAKISLEFTYSTNDGRSQKEDGIFTGLTLVDEKNASGALLYGLGENRRKLGLSARDEKGNVAGYYELDSAMNLRKVDDAITQQFIETRFALPTEVIKVEESSVLVVDDRGRRWRLPKGMLENDALIVNGKTRICREVATERDLFHAHGTFYELPAENADGYAKIRPVASHNFRIHDYASYRGMLILSGLDPTKDVVNEHIIKSEDGKLALWAGVIDDLWKLGRPTGVGGPLFNTQIQANTPSDPYLIGFYDQRKVSLTHNGENTIQFTLEVNPIGHGPWMVYKRISVPANETVMDEFAEDFEARWIRIVVDKPCKATARFEYS